MNGCVSCGRSSCACSADVCGMDCPTCSPECGCRFVGLALGSLKDLVERERKAALEGKIRKLIGAFDWNAYHKQIGSAIGENFGLVVATQGPRGAAAAGGEFRPDDPFMKETLTGYVGKRIVELDAYSKDSVSALVQRVLEKAEGLTTVEIGDLIADEVRTMFDGYADWRADRIARTETAIAYNYGDLFGYHQSGVDSVIVNDGDQDPECNAVDGTTKSLAWALDNPVAHPNCERAFSPKLNA